MCHRPGPLLLATESPPFDTVVNRKSVLCQQLTSSQDNSRSDSEPGSSLAVGPANGRKCSPSRRRLRARSGIFRAALLSEAGSCARQSPARFDDRASGRWRSAGGGRNARGRRYAGRRRTLLRSSEVWSSCLAPDPTDGASESRARTKALLRFGARMRFETGTERGSGTTMDADGQTKTARGGFFT
jgi:hypothetical protein